MGFLELLLIAVGLSADAFAVAACTGLTMPRATVKKSVIVGLYFGFFQAFMPLAGWLSAMLFADKIIAFDHWIAFALLSFIGGKMAAGSFKTEDCSGGACAGRGRTEAGEASLSPAAMLPLAVATSIDALAVGVSLAFLRVNILPAVLFIGTVTFALSMLGVKIGNIFGLRFKSKAELAGGVILILLGVKILLEHTVFRAPRL